MAFFKRGEEFFELSNHLGNVLATVTDRKVAVDADNNGTIDYYTGDVASANDYYPFGMQMPGRKYSSATPYLYGFNGKEEDDNLKVDGNQQDYGMRIYDPRWGVFLSVDALTRNSPFYTRYSFAGNKSIAFIDLDGLEEAQPKVSIITGGWNAQLTVQRASDQNIKEDRRGMGASRAIGGEILVDVFVTKEWLEEPFLTLKFREYLNITELNLLKEVQHKTKGQ